jgi:hypothetical protein
MAGKITIMALFAVSALWLAPSSALAGGSGSGCGCKKPPPPPPPPCHCKTPPKTTVNVPVNVVVNTNVENTNSANAVANAFSTANASATAASQSNSSGGGGMAAGGLTAPTENGSIQGLDVGGERRSAYEETRSLYKKVVIQAFCFDDKMTPHPASQVTPDREIDDLYEGELYRCIAGAHMQVTIADFKQDISFAGGQTLTCAKGEALYHFAGASGGRGGARLECRAQKPARDCNERSLLRRFGAGIKILSMTVTEKYTAYREESSSSSGTLTLDGGVGGVAY